MKSVGTLKKKLLFRLGSLFVNSDWLFVIYRLRKSVIKRVVTNKSDLCIEGFQRSGNSYLFMCLSISNPNLSIAHHIHGIAHIKYAISLNVPCVILIREPSACIASLLTWDNRLGLDIAIQSYINFHKHLLKLVESVLIVSFEDLIRDVNLITKVINSNSTVMLNENPLSQSVIKFHMNNRQAKYKSLSATPFPSQHKAKSNELNRLKVMAHKDYPYSVELYEKLILHVKY